MSVASTATARVTTPVTVDNPNEVAVAEVVVAEVIAAGVIIQPSLAHESRETPRPVSKETY